jgi:hypothetical protein
MLRRVALVRTDVSYEIRAFIITVTRISELAVVTVNVVPSSPIPVTVMVEVLISYETSVLKELCCVTSQKMQFFIITDLKISNLT